MNLQTWVIGFLLPSSLLGAILFVRTWLVSSVQGAIRLRVDAQIEELRADLRASEDRLNSELRAKEAEIIALRNIALDGRSRRQALIFERRLLAIEKLWAATMKLSSRKMAALTLAVFNLDVIIQRAPDEPSLREILRVSSGIGGDLNLKGLDASNQRPFVSDLSWAIYSAYSAIIMGSAILMQGLIGGMRDATKLIKTEDIFALVKAVLPHQSFYIDQHGMSGLPHLLDEIEKVLLTEFKTMLAGGYDDRLDVERAAIILTTVEDVRRNKQL